LAGDAGEVLHRLYGELLDLTGIGASLQPDGRLHGAYNLLLTRQWMLLVPRRHECFAGISLNALAFAGALLTRDRQESGNAASVRPDGRFVPCCRGVRKSGLVPSRDFKNREISLMARCLSRFFTTSARGTGKIPVDSFLPPRV
jgi:hypothetical protein